MGDYTDTYGRGQTFSPGQLERCAARVERAKARPCTDCVNVHGDDPREWLRKWPTGADYSEEHDAHLCDGCLDERIENDMCHAEDFERGTVCGLYPWEVE